MSSVVVGVVGGPVAAEPGARLAELEAVVDRAAAAFLQAGEALHELRSARLYRLAADSWSVYLRERWGMSVQAAHRLESAWRCSRAIEAAGMDLPANASPELFRPLSPVLRGRGEAGVVDAWRLVLASADGSRPLSGERVRAVLASADAPTTAPDRRKAPLKPIRLSVSRALLRARALERAYVDQVAPVSVRSRAAELAQQCAELAAVFERLSDTSAAAVRLAAIEPPAAPPVDSDPSEELRRRLGARRIERAMPGRDALAAVVRGVLAADEAGDDQALRGVLLDGAAQLVGWAEYLERKAQAELDAQLTAAAA